jgi:peptidoglycan/LPS O-acetylase OafA/YrhL
MVLIDGMRGIAAVAVVLFHVAALEYFSGNHGVVGWLNGAASAVGARGVEIFFVISGFVISYSLRGERIDGSFAMRFALRRSLRLDPPYWATIAGVLLVSVVMAKVAGGTSYEMPGAGTVVANVFYLQGILHKPQLLAVFWTLCYEVQFYLAYLILQALAQVLSRWARWWGEDGWLMGILLVTSGASLAWYAAYREAGAWCGNWWYLFALGAVIYRGWRMDRRWVGAAMCASMAVAAYGLGSGEAAFGALAGSVICAAIWADRLYVWLGNGVCQYLGRISYSLYLTHVLVLHLTLSVLTHVRRGHALHDVPAYAVMVLAPVVVADLFYRAVERPSHRLAKRVGKRKAAAGAECVEKDAAPLVTAGS